MFKGEKEETSVELKPGERQALEMLLTGQFFAGNISREAYEKQMQLIKPEPINFKRLATRPHAR